MTSTDVLIANHWTESNNTLCKDIVVKNNGNALEQLLRAALKDLREDDQTKNDYLAQLREWIKQNPDIENCLTDERFLLRFLRVRKYSLLMAQQTLLKYLNLKNRFGMYMIGMDYKEPKVEELITEGYIFVSPFRDSKGRRVILYNVEKFDLHRYSNIIMGKAHVITYEAVLDDEETQILGVNHVANMNGISAAFASLFSIAEFMTIIRWGEQSFPMRHKAINLLNVPTALKYAYDFCLSNMSKKLNDRFTLHNTMEDLCKTVDKECLPREFGGNMPMAEMIKLWKEELASKRERLMSFDQMKLLSVRGIISRKNLPPGSVFTNCESLPGSFRQLQLD